VIYAIISQHEADCNTLGLAWRERRISSDKEDALLTVGGSETSPDEAGFILIDAFFCFDCKTYAFGLCEMFKNYP
jgi:hypothetical protein